MNIYDERKADSLKVNLYSRFGEQVFNHANTRLEVKSMLTARYLNEKMEEYKKEENSRPI